MHLVFETDSSLTHLENTLKGFVTKYGSIEHLDQRVQISRCSDPTIVDDLVLWKTLSKPVCSLKETVHYESAELISVLTPRRVELLEFLRREQKPISVTDLAKKIRRNYKNVYDDIKVLSNNGLVDRLKTGREVMVSTRVKKIHIAFEDGDNYY
ncbi:MAG TPA: HTH domain-containing protein [Euryarchaeota archaeon]|nr:HTH domain-containing protein [Euryarchaeota archaeon]